MLIIALVNINSYKHTILLLTSQVYFAMLIPLIFILPRLTDSLHPGNGGNPGFNVYDLDSQLRIVFYPAVVGFILLGIWITDIKLKLSKLNKTL